MQVQYVNPIINSVDAVFQTLLDWKATRGAIVLKNRHDPDHDISGVVGFSGPAAGKVVLSFDKQTALRAAESLLGEPQLELNAEVQDVVGELTNMVAGAAKARLALFALNLTLPTVVTGNVSAVFPTHRPPIYIPFETPWGGLAVEVSLIERL